MKISPHTIRRALLVRGVHLAWCSVLIFVPGRTFAVDCTRDVALLALIHSTGRLSQRERATAVCVAFIITHVRGANGFGMCGSGGGEGKGREVVSDELLLGQLILFIFPRTGRVPMLYRAALLLACLILGMRSRRRNAAGGTDTITNWQIEK